MGELHGLFLPTASAADLRGACHTADWAYKAESLHDTRSQYYKDKRQTIGSFYSIFYV